MNGFGLCSVLSVMVNNEWLDYKHLAKLRLMNSQVKSVADDLMDVACSKRLVDGPEPLHWGSLVFWRKNIVLQDCGCMTVSNECYKVTPAYWTKDRIRKRKRGADLGPVMPHLRKKYMRIGLRRTPLCRPEEYHYCKTHRPITDLTGFETAWGQQEWAPHH